MLLFLRLCVVFGLLASAFYLSWWLQEGRLLSLPLALLLAGVLLYGGMQMAGNWFLYLFAYRSLRGSLPPPEDLTVDVFVTSCGEPHALVERALAAACALRYPHQTWLLDDGADPQLAALAERLGAGYLTRPDRRDAKAGNLNAALPRTQGEIIAIFDIDHVPEPDFLEQSLGFFRDPQVGFVQVMLTFDNGAESWVAQAALETSLEFYNPTSLGADGIGGATLMGSNALIRRAALESIGGYQPGLAEDLATSIHLHAAGWKSTYLAEPLAPGLAPPSFAAWFTQQLKWARGVFELLLTAYPRLFWKLEPGQRLSYAVRMTKYWIGPVVAFHLFATIAVLTFAGPELRADFHQYLIYISPLAVSDVLIRHAAFRLYRHSSVPNASLARAVSLVYATWPIYTLAWLMAALRLPLKFKPTPKDRHGRFNPLWLLPQALAMVLILGGTAYTVWVRNHPLSLLLLFAAIQALVQFIFLAQWLYSQPVFQPARRFSPATGPAAILDIDLANLPASITGLSQYRQAFVLARLHGRPAGQSVLDLHTESLSAAEIRQRVLRDASWEFWQTWLADWAGHPETRPEEIHLSVTVAVCTRDRPEDLRRCLAGLQRLPDMGQEILVVDSASQITDVPAIVAHFPGVRCVREAIPGLDRARNRAILETRTKLLAFIDDDAVPDPGWLVALVQGFTDPRVQCVTGLTLPLELDTPAQQWFEWFSSFGRGYTRKMFDKTSLHPLSAGHAGAGVNMAFRVEVFRRVDLFDEALDAGTVTLSGGDTEMFGRILEAGYAILYNPAALSWHRHRRDWRSLRRTIYGYGCGTYAFWTRRLLVEHQLGVIPIALDWALRYQLPAILRSLLRLPGRMPFDLLLAELLGCLAGPQAYLRARKNVKNEIHEHHFLPDSAEPGQRHYSHS